MATLTVHSSYWNSLQVIRNILGVLIVILIVVSVYTQIKTPSLKLPKFKIASLNLQRTEQLRELDRRKPRLKKIVYWKPFSHRKDFGFGTGHEPFVTANCKVSTCTATYSKAEVNDADAVMFHLPDCRGKLVIPTNRLPHQVYVFIVRECPAHEHLKHLEKFNNFFNIAMTYSREADVLFPFGRIEKRGEIPYKPYGKDIMQNKTKFALAIISHCKTTGKREDVIKALQLHVQIDVLGGCRKHKQENPACMKNYGIPCIRKVIQEYKFYFAFESFLCRDYASEKLYKVLDMSVIPVVYGGSNYSELLPPHSFIDVRDFKTAASLAAYLQEVASDTDKFLSYFTWRRGFRQTVEMKMAPGPYQVPDPRAFCDLCEYIHVNRTKKKVISDMLEVFGAKKFCIKPGAWLTNFVKKV